MAYSTNPSTLASMMPDLLPLMEPSGSAVWRTDEGAARWFAYRIREALYIARTLGGPEPLRRRFRVIVVGPSLVKVSLQLSRKAQFIGRLLENEAPEPQAQTYVDTRTLSFDTFLDEVVRSWASRRGENKLHLSRANATRVQLMQLYSWCQTEGLCFFEADGGALTIMTKLGNEDTAMYAWDPSDPQES